MRARAGCYFLGAVFLVSANCLHADIRFRTVSRAILTRDVVSVSSENHTAVLEESLHGNSFLQQLDHVHVNDPGVSVSKPHGMAARCCYSSVSRKDLEPVNVSTCAARTERWTLQTEEEWARYVRDAFKHDDHQCRLMWTELLEARLGCAYIRDVSLKRATGEPTGFDYVPEVPGVPRVLVLGDSITAHARASLRQRMIADDVSYFTLHNPPENCGGIDLYDKFLSIWLGTCAWDLVQFNLGHHCDARAEQLSKYTSDLIRVTRRIQEHSPGAHVVFATTTPSPFDTSDTFPNISTCEHYHKFHYPGRVPALNLAAWEALEPMNVTINDRFALLEPHLKDYQYPCDIHFTERGSDVIAEADLELFGRLLTLQNLKKR